MRFIYSAMRIGLIRVEFPEEILPAEGRIPHVAERQRVYCAGDVYAYVTARRLSWFEFDISCHVPRRTRRLLPAIRFPTVARYQPRSPARPAHLRREQRITY